MWDLRICSSLYLAYPDHVLLLASAKPILLLILPGLCHPLSPRAAQGWIVVGVPRIMQQQQDPLLETPAFVHLALLLGPLASSLPHLSLSLLLMAVAIAPFIFLLKDF